MKTEEAAVLKYRNLVSHSLVQFKLLHPEAKCPQRGTSHSGALDIFVPTSGEIWPGQTMLVGTGLAHRVHPGYQTLMKIYSDDMTQWQEVPVPFQLQGLLFGRSGLATKYKIRPSFAPCLIDADYRGEIKLSLENVGDDVFRWQAGDRLCQIMYVPTYMGEICITDTLDATERGEGGFGHTQGVSHG
jgi:dUTP pyrophosphatase